MGAHAKLTVGQKLGFGIGDLGIGLFFQATLLYLFFFYTDIAGMSPKTVAFVFIIARALDAIACPLIGAAADRTRSRWGRFRPYIAIASVPLSIGLLATFSTISGSVNAKATFAILTYSAFSICYATVAIPYSALMGTMTSDPAERTQLGTLRSIFSFSAGLIVASVMLPIAQRWDGRTGFQIAAIVVAGIALPTLWTTVLTSSEAIRPRISDSPNFQDIFRAIGTRPLLTMVLIFVLANIAIVLRSAGALYFFKYSLQMPQMTSAYLTSSSVALIAAIVLTPAVTRRLGRRSTMIAALALAAIGQVLVCFLPQGIVSTFVFAGILPAVGQGLLAAAIWPMLSDCIDFAEWRLNRRVEAAAFGLVILGQKLALALGGALSGWTLAQSGYVANMAQSESSLQGILALFGYGPAIFTVLSLVLAIAYPLTEAKMSKVQTELETRYAEGAALVPA